MRAINIESIYKEVLLAQKNISDHIHHTALLKSHELSRVTGGAVYLKCENEQFTGSFKARGSLNKILSISQSEKENGLITASTGNHALGFSRALAITGTKGTVYLPKNASEAKLKALSYYPSELVKYGEDSLSTELYARRKAVELGKTWMSPYNDVKVIGGQGTIGIEILKKLPHVDSVLCTVGGGGLISGIGSYLKFKNKNIEIVGCQPENSPEMTLSIKAGHIVGLPEYIPTLSDGSAGGIEPDAITFDLCKNIIDKCILVSEEEIRNAIRLVFQNHKKVIEGAAGVAVASLLKEPTRFENKTVVIVLCGSNIDSQKFVNIINNTH